jgi:protein TonB
MEPNKILSANLLDLIFDDRNKEYGAYELRTTYPERIKRSLIITGTIAGLIFGGAVLANSFKPKESGKIIVQEVTLTDLKDPEEVKPLPEPERKPEPQQVHTEQFTPPVITHDEDVDQPPPTMEDLSTAIVDVKTQSGIDADGIVDVPAMDEGKKIIEEQKPDDNRIRDFVQVPARYDGNWEKFLLRNLNGNIPIDNGAPAGTYRVIVQFVVDKHGNVSDIKAISNLGYGMEEEAMRVLRKATGWKAGIQEGREVACYHKQPITFVVEAE